MRTPGPTIREVSSPLLDGDLAHVLPFVGHPTLRDAAWGMCSDRKNVAAWNLLPLGDPPCGHPKSMATSRARQPR